VRSAEAAGRCGGKCELGKLAGIRQTVAKLSSEL